MRVLTFYSSLCYLVLLLLGTIIPPTHAYFSDFKQVKGEVKVASTSDIVGYHVSEVTYNQCETSFSVELSNKVDKAITGEINGHLFTLDPYGKTTILLPLGNDCKPAYSVNVFLQAMNGFISEKIGVLYIKETKELVENQDSTLPDQLLDEHNEFAEAKPESTVDVEEDDEKLEELNQDGTSGVIDTSQKEQLGEGKQIDNNDEFQEDKFEGNYSEESDNPEQIGEGVDEKDIGKTKEIEENSLVPTDE